MQTISLSYAGQVSDPVSIGPGARVTTTGSGYVEYTTASMVDIRNNVPITWTQWPKASATGFCDSVRRIIIRGVAAGAFTVKINEGQNDEGPEGVYWQESLPSFALDASGNVTGLVGPNGVPILFNTGPLINPTARPRIGVFGNSIAAQSTTSYPPVTTTTAAAAKAGDTTITLTSVTGFVDATKIGIQAYDGTVMKVVQNGVAAGSIITLAAPLQKAVRSGAAVNIYDTQEPSLLRNAYGIMSTAVTLLGGRVEPVVNGYGWGGASARSMLIDLPNYLKTVRPRYVVLHLFENDITTQTLEALQSMARRAAAICISNGVVPIFVPIIPSTNYTGSAVCAIYDGLVRYITATLPSIYPQVKSVDLSTLWLDTTQPTNRYPLEGWTDGIHPNLNKQYTIAATAAPLLAAIIPEINYSIADYSIINNPTLAGSGGTVNGGGTKSGVAADNWTCTTNTGATTVNSKNADGTQKIVFTNANSTETTQNFQFEQTFTLDAGSNLAQTVKAYMKLRINSKSNINYHTLYIIFSGGETDAFGVGTTAALSTSDSTGVILTLETLGVKVPAGSTTVLLRYSANVVIGGVAVAMDLDIIEAGILSTLDFA